MTTGTPLRDLYEQTRNMLRESGVDNPDLVARHFIKHTMDVNDIDMIITSRREISTGMIEEVNECLKRHISGEPVSRIFGEREFWGMPFAITPDVLDPRPETEIIIDVALKRFFGDPPLNILDLGTGSGCLIIALLHEWPRANGIGSDICEKALAVAQENAARRKTGKRLKFKQSDWGQGIEGKFDLIVSNPPYIANREIPNLPPEVKNYDPILALQAGEDGLDCYKAIIPEIKSLLGPKGICLLETGFSQADDVTRLVEDSGLSVQGVHPDLAGIPRVVEISFGEK